LKTKGPDYQRLAANIRERRHKLCLTQAEASLRANCAVSTWRRMEQGEGGLSAEMLFRAAKALECRASALVEGA